MLTFSQYLQNSTRLDEASALPRLVDGRDVFLRDDEKIVRAAVVPPGIGTTYFQGGDHVYVTTRNIRPYRGENWAITFPRPIFPGSRVTTRMPVSHLQIYPEDLKIWQAATLLENQELPVPTDGRDIFLKDGEKIYRAIAHLDKPTPVYISSLSKPIYREVWSEQEQKGVRVGFIKTFVLTPGDPNSRFYTTIPLDYLDPYSDEDVEFWQTIKESVDKYTLVDFLLDEQDTTPVEKQTKTKKHTKWKPKEQALTRSLDIVAKGTQTD